MRRLFVYVAALTATCLCWAALAAGGASAASAGPAITPPQLQVTGASLIVAGSGQPLYGYRASSKRAIASTTKLMTALIVLERVHNLNRIFTQNHFYPAAEDSQIGLMPGEKMTVRNLLKAMLIPSADDAAEDLAYNVGGHSVKRFLKLMNAEARKLGLTHTHYTTPTGLDTPGNYSTPNDLVRLAEYDMHYSAFFRQTVRTAATTIANASGRLIYPLQNTDTLLGAVPWIDGIKTGHTADAGYVLVSEGHRDGLTLIGSVLGTVSEQARNNNALALLDWGFANFHQVQPVTKNKVYAKPKVAYRSTPAKLVAAYSYARVVPRHARVRLRVHAPRQLSGPLKKGTVIGDVKVYIDRHERERVPLILARALPAVSGITKAAHFIGRPFTLIGILLLVAGAVATLRRRRKGPNARGRATVLTTGGIEER